MPGSDIGRVGRRTFLSACAALVASACSHATRRTSASGGSMLPTAPTTTSSLRGDGPAAFVRAGPSDRAAFALTFHGSGDVALLHQLLAVAARSATPITVFAVGKWLDENPGVARTLLDAGHELANHTYTHPALATVDRAGVATEITRCRDALARRAGSVGRWFRPSGIDVPTALMLEEAGRAGYPTVVGFSVDPHDYQDPGADLVASRTIAGLARGAIVSLHTGHGGTVDAFERIVAAARSRGLQPVLLRDLLAA